MPLLHALALLSILLLSTLQAHAIVIRHDVDAAHYITPSEHYPEVVSFLEPEAHWGTSGAASLSGTFLSPHWVLTAAHGGDIFEGSHVRIQTGGAIYEDVPFERWFPHPCFDEKESPMDLGLVYFPSPPWPGLERYPSLFTGDDELGKVILFVGQGAMGDGRLGDDDDASDGTMRHATNTVDHLEESLVGFTFNAPEDEGVTILEGISGDGDSGGPAFICEELTVDPAGRVGCEGQRRLVGVSSHQLLSSESTKQGTYGVQERYVRVSAHRDWIEHAMATQSAGSCEDFDPEATLATELGGCSGSSTPDAWWAIALALACLGTRRQRYRSAPRA